MRKVSRKGEYPPARGLGNLANWNPGILESYVCFLIALLTSIQEVERGESAENLGSAWMIWVSPGSANSTRFFMKVRVIQAAKKSISAMATEWLAQ